MIIPLAKHRGGKKMQTTLHFALSSPVCLSLSCRMPGRTSRIKFSLEARLGVPGSEYWLGQGWVMVGREPKIQVGWSKECSVLREGNWKGKEFPVIHFLENVE